MYDEARLFFESIVRENRSVVSFVDGDYTFLNGTLAPLYGLEKTVTGPEMRKVKLTDRQSRRHFGDARHPGDDLLSQPHQPREAAACGCSNRCSGNKCRRPRRTFRPWTNRTRRRSPI